MTIGCASQARKCRICVQRFWFSDQSATMGAVDDRGWVLWRL